MFIRALILHLVCCVTDFLLLDQPLHQRRPRRGRGDVRDDVSGRGDGGDDAGVGAADGPGWTTHALSARASRHVPLQYHLHSLILLRHWGESTAAVDVSTFDVNCASGKLMCDVNYVHGNSTYV